MEFLEFLTTKDKQVLELITKAGFSVEENTPLCLLGEKFFGFLKKKQKTVVICTRNAKQVGGYFLPGIDKENDYNPTRIYITRALRHEAVHVAQSCKRGNLLSAAQAKMIELHPFKKKALKGSTRVSGNKKNELEAYWMEDKPRLVINALKKYCL